MMNEINYKTMAAVGAAAALMAFAVTGFAEEPAKTMDKAGHRMEEAANTVEDKTCETVNGKVQCAGKKMKHKIKKASNRVKESVE
jgi:hypothetical protein